MTHLVWFRNDLRVTDHIPLTQACKASKKVIAIYCFDPRHFGTTNFGFPKTGAFRAKFLLQSVSDLKKNLQALNIPLVLKFQKPEEAIPALVAQFSVKSVHFQKEWTSEELAVSKTVEANVSKQATCISYYNQFLFHPEDIPYADFNKIPKVFTEFRKKCEKYTKVRDCVAIPDKRPEFDLNLSEKFQNDIPTLKELGLEPPPTDSRTAFPFSGGETSGIERIQEYIWKKQHITTYKQTRNELIGTAYSSKFSAWLANGCISPRTIYWEIKKFEKEVTKNQDTYWMIFELIWRDFFKYVSLKHGDALFKIGGILEKKYDWGTSEEKKQDWITGNTPYDFVNANMKEIAKTGWMSNRGRQNVASSWAKEWKQDWRIGASYFESQLIDYDVHSNWGNWQYVSGVGNDPRDRKFNIERQAENYDPHGDFVALWKE
ncbi:MAG TPA: DASH family cryptochrome [Flavobacteriaceae bacterium]|nr:DASH family cryptochrome [Flavobacteriaceae bacterium]HIN97785.1 DASH family cryptochrome [Flavobacteriaceae bacterium]